MNSLYLSIEEELEMLEQKIDLPQMYNDLGKIKALPLTLFEKQLLRLKLTGHDTNTIAKYLGKKSDVIAVEYSRSLKNYIEDFLIDEGLIPEPAITQENSKVKPKANWTRFILLLREK